MIQRVQACIDRRALAHNFAIATRHARGSRMLAVVKANAYGHGAHAAVEALQQADLFGVTDINEAEQLRAAGCTKGILVLQGLIDATDITRIASNNFEVVIHQREHLAWLEQYLDRSPPPKPLTFWLKLDSGMGRLGLLPAEYPAIYRALAAKPWTRKVILMTHFANASLPDSGLNGQQLACFASINAQLQDNKPETSLASSAVLLALDTNAVWARPGIMLYGSSPFAWPDASRRRECFGLQAVMTLQARLISIKDLQAGDNVGYNSQFICPRAMRVGIVSAGYADGYPSNTPNSCPVAVRGERTRTLGRVSMDMLAIDLDHLPQAEVGDAVELWGPTVSLDEVAAHTGILSYNLTCSITARVPRVYV